MNGWKRPNHPMWRRQVTAGSNQQRRLRGWLRGLIGVGIPLLLGVDPMLRIPEVMAQIAQAQLDPADPPSGRSPDVPNMGFDGVRSEGERPATEGWIGRLNLTPRQLRRIQVIRRNRQPQLLQAQRELRQARRALGILVTQDDVSTDSIREQYASVRALDDQVRELRFEILLRIREVLTPAQRQELGIILEERLPKY